MGAPCTKPFDYAGSRCLGHYTNRLVSPDETIPWCYLQVRVTMRDGSGECTGELKLERPEAGRMVLEGDARASVSLDFHGLALAWTLDLRSYPAFHRALSRYEVEGGTDALWSWWLAAHEGDLARRSRRGSKAIERRRDVKPNLDRLAREEPLLWRFFAWLHDDRTRDRTSNNKLLAAMLAEVGADYDALRAELRRVLDAVPSIESPQRRWEDRMPDSRNVCLSLVGSV